MDLATVDRNSLSTDEKDLLNINHPISKGKRYSESREGIPVKLSILDFLQLQILYLDCMLPPRIFQSR